MPRAMIIIHGEGRKANDYFSTAMAAAFLADAIKETIVISPRYASNAGRTSKDSLAENEIAWESLIAKESNLMTCSTNC